MAGTVNLRLRAAPLDASAPPHLFDTRLRSVVAGDDDPFLPAGLLHIDAACDLSATARAADSGRIPRDIEVKPGQVVVLELPEGVTVITHPDNLREAVRRTDPDAVSQDGTIDFSRALRQRGAGLRGSLGDAMAEGLNSVVSRLYTVTVGQVADPILDAARRRACEWLGITGEDKISQYAELGVSWIGTKALMWAIESRLQRNPGLYRYIDGELAERFDPGDPRLAADSRSGPLLVMIHGTGSSTGGSFDALHSASRTYWKAFEERYAERVLAFEHRTLSESPAENALALARALPAAATVHLLTHSRGGLVGDLLCLQGLDEWVDGYALDGTQAGDSDTAERERVRAELVKAYAEQRSVLHELAAELRRKRLRIERYVRVASPARGTRLASGNFDVFLSALLSLMGWVPSLKGNPVYSAFKRVVLEIAKNRTRPDLVPGIEAMLPASPMARLLARATPQDKLQLAVIAGDVEGGGWLKRLGVLFTDYTFFDGEENDFVVDTDAMVAGIARPGVSRVLLDRSAQTSHFRYFINDGTRSAVREWLTAPATDQVEAFQTMRAAVTTQAPPARTARGTTAIAPAMPVAVLLPAIMGSHLWLARRERIWFDVMALAHGGLGRLQLKPGARKDAVEPEALFDMHYGALQRHLSTTHRVVPFAFDWRQPLDVLATQLAGLLRRELDAAAAAGQPLRVLAHSMGGLVVRALVHLQPQLWDELMTRDGARLVMLGTPHQGSHLMVETLLGKSDAVRRLALLDLEHDLQQVVDIIASFPGALALLPKPGFADTGGEQATDYFEAALWPRLKSQMRDLWLGDGVGAAPPAAALRQAQWLWSRDRNVRPALPARHEGKVIHVFGCAAKTPCGLVREGDRWKMLGTPLGDGSVTWDSGRIDGIGQFLYMPAEHGALADTEAYFDSIESLLDRGDAGQLMTSPPAMRGADLPRVAAYDAGPTTYPTELEAAAGLFGAGRAAQSRVQRADVLNVRVRAMDLRQVTHPILVGHYEQDAISGPESLIDRELVRGELTVRHHLGLYAGPVGTASCVILQSSEQERQRGSMRGAVVAGLGPYDGSLSVTRLAEAVRTACLRYLVHVQDSGFMAVGDQALKEVRLASLLLGYNSSASLSIADSVQALMRGVVEANRHFAQASGSPLRIGCLDIVEIYLDSAITATYAAHAIAKTMNANRRLDCRIEADPLLHQGEGVRLRLYQGRTGIYWPRMMITDADHDDGDGTSAAAPARPALAQRLRYLYVGQRARAESIVQQRQPGLVEKLVERQVMAMQYDPDFSRTLFQLLVPHDFKDAARQLQQMVLVLDSRTANYPWELMLADDEPLATRTAMVRQLSSTRFRARVNQTMEARAYVVGNPSTSGFFVNFPDPKLREQDALEDLPAAEREAVVVTDALARHGFDVERALGSQQRALDVVNRLYRHPYRIVHVAGHGVYEDGPDGTRSGVVLSDGLLISAAEIDAMEIVPDLVFLNCCHLGRIDRSPVSFNRLASSVGRQLIEIGVRAVIVAGWAVEDAPASLFASTFYETLLGENLSFGEAVFRARCAAWAQYPTSITWGAYQAYGDPGWRIDPKSETPSSEQRDGSVGAAPEELLDLIQAERQAVQRSGEILSRMEARRIAERVRQALDAKPPEWNSRPDLLSAVAELYTDLGPGFFEQARDQFRLAVAAADREGRVPIRAIERLGNVEARLGEAHDDAAMVARGIARLEGLVRLTGGRVAGDPETDSGTANSERASLLGSAWKRKAGVHARAYLRQGRSAEFALMAEAIARSEANYRTMASRLGDQEIRPYPTLNWLFLWSLTARREEWAAYLPHARRCAMAANAAFAEDPGAYNATMVPDAALVGALLAGTLAKASAGDATLDGLIAGYEDALRTALVTPKERDTVVKQIRFMALFHRAYEKHGHVDAPNSVGSRLERLADRLSPPTPDDGVDDSGDDGPASSAASDALGATQGGMPKEKARPSSKPAKPAKPAKSARSTGKGTPTKSKPTPTRARRSRPAR